MIIQRLKSIALTTDASGDCTAYSDVPVTGRVYAVKYVKTDFDDTADITITTENTVQTILTLTNITASATKYPRSPVQDETGVNATLDGTRLLREPICVFAERIKIVVAQGGNVKTGAIIVLLG